MNTITKTIVLDLDDTLYSELDFLKSAYKFIAEKLSTNSSYLYEIMYEKYKDNEDVFSYLESTFNINKTTLLDYYRFHIPNITPYQGVEDFFKKYYKIYNFSIVTDGRSKTQRNKIEVLGIGSYINNIIISEEIGSQKPNPNNYKQAIAGIDSNRIYYIGDNTKKDFITPNKLGWTTVCLEDSGYNIHKQDFTIDKIFLPHYRFKSWSEISLFFDTDI